ncbi:MAG: hypothetical protein M1816_000835 [Peltula sp. TS41687]|nr:MAG: hypothetical protein M1816_000835 [Peltula sp. TS41687]
MTPAQPRDLSPSLIQQQHGFGEAGLPRPYRTTTNLDPNRLAPEDAFYAHSPPRRQLHGGWTDSTVKDLNGSVQRHLTRGLSDGRRKRDRDRGRSGSRKTKGVWKKLLWVKQSYPDNYTDEETFLDHLQRNPRLRPYEFWPLVADSTVIVQHVCSVAIFVCCFVGIFQERVSPVAVVSWANLATVLGWAFWDRWAGPQETGASLSEPATNSPAPKPSASSNGDGSCSPVDMTLKGLGVTIPVAKDESMIPPPSNLSPAPPISGHPTGASRFANYNPYPPYGKSTWSFSPRNQQRLATAKSAGLIYCALLGLSPILKSLTKSTTSDSIWAMSCWLMCINVFFFDYGGAVVAKAPASTVENDMRPVLTMDAARFPASLSTNAALMASTVLASRLPSTTHVFSLTLFSIEVFGLFPIFRRHLRLISWRGHLALTFALVTCAGGGMGITISGGGWRAATGGVVLGWFLTSLTMGGCSWWLISLQKYKNEIHGPWDPARPIIRRHWD